MLDTSSDKKCISYRNDVTASQPESCFMYLGKPVYSRHGSEDKLAPLMGVLLALVSCVYDRKDTMRHVIAGDHKFVFMPRAALILVGICSTKESLHQVWYCRICSISSKELYYDDS